MVGERLRVALAEDYADALGRAAYTFALLEWQVVWCGERIKPGFLAAIQSKTAGQIGVTFRQAVHAMNDPALRASMLPLADEFLLLVKERNGILHGKPGTVSGSGEQRLFRNGQPWHIPDLEDAADRFAACNIQLNAYFHGALQHYQP